MANRKKEIYKPKPYTVNWFFPYLVEFNVKEFSE